ncbi:MAG TPA: CvpA family protein, partial [Candidatus Dorea gallistercoris]|nr:CvpA family protein [Candidatus Dorea gallistercoris]
MNWVVLTVGLIFLLCILMGVYKGAVKIAVSLATTLLTLVIVFFASPLVADLIENKTPLDEVIENQVISTMAGAVTSQVEAVEEEGISADTVRQALAAAGVSEETLEEYGISIDDIVNGNISGEALEKYGISSGVLEGLTGESSETTAEEVIENADIPRDIQIAAIEAADLPELFKSLLAENNNDAIYEDLGAQTFAQYVGSFLAKLIINIVAFLVTFILVSLILRAIVFALDIVANLPVLGAINRVAGGAIGAVGALIIVWILFIFVTLLYVTSFGREASEMIQGNMITKMLYEYNPLMSLA